MPQGFTTRMSSAESVVTRQTCLLLGSNGSGMTALKEILIDADVAVSGMDRSGYPEATVFAKNLMSTPATGQMRQLPWSDSISERDVYDFCVCSPAIPKDASLRQSIVRRGIPIMSLHQCLAKVFANRHQICVAGTHGKSTTSTMLAWILQHCGQHPGYFIGAKNWLLGQSGCLGTGVAVVMESCEFSRSFLQFSPTIGVLTGIERDHFDCFPEQESEDAAFQEFASRIPDHGHLIYCLECARSRRIASNAGCQTTSFSVEDESADWFGTDVFHHGWQTGFTCHYRSTSENNSTCSKIAVRLQVPGRHNVRNAMAAIAAATAYGVSVQQCVAALAEFTGIQRRFEPRGQYGGVTLVDDYAHHPSAVRETLLTARQVFPNRKIVAVFEPHQVVRTKSLFAEFVEALQLADEIQLLPVFPAREQVSHLECCRISGSLVRELNSTGAKAFLFASLDQVVSRLDYSGRSSDVLITMGAGRTNIIHDELNRRLQRHFVA